MCDMCVNRNECSTVPLHVLFLFFVLFLLFPFFFPFFSLFFFYIFSDGGLDFGSVFSL